MNIHKLSLLTPFGREVVVQRVAAGVAWYATQGIAVEWLLTDNVGAYRSTVGDHGHGPRQLSMLYPSVPPANEREAERSIRTLLAECAYATAYGRSGRRTQTLPTYLTFYDLSALQE